MTSSSRSTLMTETPDLLDKYHQKIMKLLEDTTPPPNTTSSAILTTTAPKTAEADITATFTSIQWEPLISSCIILMAVLLLVTYH